MLILFINDNVSFRFYQHNKISFLLTKLKLWFENVTQKEMNNFRKSIGAFVFKIISIALSVFLDSFINIIASTLKKEIALKSLKKLSITAIALFNTSCCRRTEKKINFFVSKFAVYIKHGYIEPSIFSNLIARFRIYKI